MFITFEGPDGSGKTTALNGIEKILISKGYKLLRTREPGGTLIAEQIRKVVLDKQNTAMDIKTEALLYAASRRQHLKEKIWPALKEGKIVLCDRFLDSSLAYQGAGREIGVEEVLKINLFATENTYPDLTFLFDIDPEEGLKRINSNFGREINRLDLEKLEFHKKVRNAYLQLAKKFSDRYVVIDASKDPETIINQVVETIIKKL